MIQQMGKVQNAPFLSSPRRIEWFVTFILTHNVEQLENYVSDLEDVREK